MNIEEHMVGDVLTKGMGQRNSHEKFYGARIYASSSSAWARAESEWRSPSIRASSLSRDSRLSCIEPMDTVVESIS